MLFYLEICPDFSLDSAYQLCFHLQIDQEAVKRPQFVRFPSLSDLKPVTQRCHPERDAKGKWPQCDYGHLVALRRVTEC